METPDKEPSFEDQLQQSIMIQGLLTAAPQIKKMYPQIVGLVDTLAKSTGDYLKNKMVVLVQKNGISRAIVLDPSVDFTFNNNMTLETMGNPVLNNYEMEEWKAKLMQSSLLQTLKEEYEKLSPNDRDIGPESPGIGSLLGIVK